MQRDRQREREGYKTNVSPCDFFSLVLSSAGARQEENSKPKSLQESKAVIEATSKQKNEKLKQTVKKEILYSNY